MTAASSALYRAVWRWHFYAGLIILPFVILIAVTGAIYLFKDEINDAAYGDLRLVPPQQTQPLAPSAIAAAALGMHPGLLRAYAPPAAPDRAAQVKILGEDGLTDTVYVDPHTGLVIGTAWDSGVSGSTAMWLVRKLHSLEYAGWIGNRIVEAVAGWMVVLVATGVYLWLPRGRNVGTVRIRKGAKGRPWWRDLHAATGIFVAGFIVFLAMTGLPWSGVWGKQFYDLSYAAGLGMPDGYWNDIPVSTVPMEEALDRAPWIAERQPMPLSTAAGGVPVGLDEVVRKVESLGIHAGYDLAVPGDATGVFTASVYPDDIRQERVIHIDQYSGEVLFDMDLSGLGTLGRLAEWGVSIHMGQAFGLANQIVLLIACAAMVLMCISGAAMWWKRRPAGSLGAPTVPADWTIPRGILAIAVLLGIFFPLVGLSMIAIAAIELGLAATRRLRTA
ncbi:PepSY domain-containing protein [Cereibacter sp. SYSU M97828]|nr:PepSY domain-containing protein [Cereibacter flavus]